MKRVFLCLIAIAIFSNSNSQNLNDFRVTPVNKKVSEFEDVFDLSSVLTSIVTFKFTEASGRNNLYSKLCVEKNIIYWPSADSPDSKMTKSETNEILNHVIIETIEYKDSIACAIVQTGENKFSIRWYEHDNQKWLAAGEDIFNSQDECRKSFLNYTESNLNSIRREIEISKPITDTLSFINYLQNSGQEPTKFMLDALKTNKLVIYGEIHRRKISWEFLCSMINKELFPEYTGLIFMEMASNKQSEINQFLENDTINKELLLDVFRDYMIMGWADKGMFDFVISVWSVNKRLPANKKIRIIAVDTPREYTEEGLKNEISNRNEFMANTIIHYFDSTNEKRNALFIVGSAHVCKTMESAGNVLAKKYANEVFTIFTHSPRVDNHIIVKERIRHGIFDYAFLKNGDNPVGFNLKNSPFGKEPFDGLYLDGSGTYQDSYDGYLFLGNLDKEPNGEVLYELYNENFIKEMDRRYKLIGVDFMKEWELNSLTTKAVIAKIVSQQTKTRWEEYLKK